MEKMTKGQQIEYAIFKAVSEYSFVDWLETWGIEEEDWDKFMDAGKAALPKPDQVTNRYLIDFCNDMGLSCKTENCAYYEECNAYENTYGDTPFAENTLHPDRYTDEVIVIEEKERKDEKTVRTMKVELKPCPFCGGQPEIVTPEETDGQYWFIACTNDNCWGIAISDFCETESEAIDKWNRRGNGENNEDND